MDFGPPDAEPGRKATLPLSDLLILAGLLAFLCYHIPLPLLFTDTLTVGGDTPAHNYVAGALKLNLLEGRGITSWAPGWWCGFPLFQYYFCLPYLLIVMLDSILPFNVAFKLVSVSGIFALPPASYAAGRILRLPRPAPLLLAVASIPVLFVRSHTMWGVNIASTLAGMIANSIGFSIMLLATASCFRDMEDGAFRLRTVFLLAALPASHFFTTLAACLVLAAALCFSPSGTFRGRLRALAGAGLPALLIMSWWLVPLAAKREFSVDFGVNWDISLWKTLPLYVYAGLPPAVFTVWWSFKYRRGAPLVFLWMTAVSLPLFFIGFKLSPVFVNVRLWPFVFYGVVALASIGLGLLVSRLRAPNLLVAAIALAVLLHVSTREAHPPPSRGPLRTWAEFNYSGLEKMPAYPVFRDLALPLKDTPGRLANDLSPANNAMGSSRIFECVPHLIGKPILEGGLVNSAAGSLFSYYVQSETSRDCAGYPPLVRPSTFDIGRATAHLQLFNVKHLIARWEDLKRALNDSEDWKLLRRSGEWELHELTTHDGRYVTIPERPPIGVRTDRWKICALEWLYHIDSIEQPYLFIDDDAASLPAGLAGVLSESQYLDLLELPVLPTEPDEQAGGEVLEEEILPDRIRFKTTAIGRPHMVKCTYFPNWRVKGADRIYMVSPAFMLVYPEQGDVELYYGRTASDIAGYVLTAAGWILVGGIILRRRRINLSGCPER